MAKKTATPGVYISDENFSLCQKLRRELIDTAFNSTDDPNVRLESLVLALVSTSYHYSIDRETLMEAVGKVFDNAQYRVVN